MSGYRGNVRRRTVGRRQARAILEQRRAEREQRIAEQAAAMRVEKEQAALEAAQATPLPEEDPHDGGDPL